MHQFLGLKEP